MTAALGNIEASFILRSFARHFAMSSDFGIGELHSEFTKKCHQCGLLLFSARVLRVFAVGGQATDIANAYGMGVVSLAVRSHLCERSAMMHRAVAVDDEVISDGGKASLPVPAVDVCRGEVLAFRRGRAMNDDEINLAHLSPPSVSVYHRGTSEALHTSSVCR